MQKKSMRQCLEDDSGQAMVEYSLLNAMILGVVVVLLFSDPTLGWGWKSSPVSDPMNEVHMSWQKKFSRTMQWMVINVAVPIP